MLFVLQPDKNDAIESSNKFDLHNCSAVMIHDGNDLMVYEIR